MSRRVIAHHTPQLMSASGFGRANVTRAWAFLRRFLVEADALTLVELIESPAFDRAAMEEPLLTAFVADESEPAIPH